MYSSPDLAPVFVGANVTLTSQDPPGGMECPVQLLVSEKSLGSLPTMVGALYCSAVLPSLTTVTTCTVLRVPTF